MKASMALDFVNGMMEYSHTANVGGLMIAVNLSQSDRRRLDTAMLEGVEDSRK